MDRDFDPRDGEYIRIMNQFIDKLISYRLDTNEWSILMFIIRMTWGIQGRPDADLRWKSIIKATGLTESSLAKAMRKLRNRNIIHTLENHMQITRYKINSKVSTWKDPSLLAAFQGSNNLLPPKAVVTAPQGSNLLPPKAVVPYKENIIKDSIKDTPLPPQKNKAENQVPSGSELKIQNPWIDEAAWDDFVKHRINIKHPLTPLAISKAIKFLNNYQEFQQMIVDETILNNWRGLFPPKGGASRTPQSKHDRKMVKWKRRYDEKYR